MSSRRALRRVGFDVTEKTDVSNGEMGAAIAAFARAIAGAPGSAAVLYVCGYALDLDSRDFLLPSSATIDRDTDALTQGLAAKSVVDAVARANPNGGLVLLDAVATPKSSAALRFDALAHVPQHAVGFAADVTPGTPPQGATPFAAAFAASLTPPEIEVGAVLRAVATHLGSAAAATLAVAPPTAPAWLAGGPAPAAPKPAAVATPAAPPPPAIAPAAVAPAPARADARCPAAAARGASRTGGPSDRVSR